MPTAAPPSVVKLRVFRSYRFFVAILGLFLAVVYLATSAFSRQFLPAFVLWEWIGISALDLIVNSWFGINLTPTEAVVNSIRRRRIPWSRIQAVTQEPFLGGRRIVLWTDQGDRVPLRAPIVDFTSIGGRAFDAGFHTIGRWWLDHRGPGWVPVPAPVQ